MSSGQMQLSYSFISPWFLTLWHGNSLLLYIIPSFGGSEGKQSACNVGDPGLIPGLGRYPGEGNDNPLQYSCLENPMDSGAWRVQFIELQRVRTNWFNLACLHATQPLEKCIFMQVFNYMEHTLSKEAQLETREIEEATDQGTEQQHLLILK